MYATIDPFNMNTSHYNSNLNKSSAGKCIRNTQITRIVFPVLYTILFIASIGLNSLAIRIFFQIPSSSTFNIFLKNIVAADFLMTLTLPFKILSDTQLAPWQVRWFVCRFSSVIFYFTMYVSIILLGLVSLDRFLKITKPFGRSCLHKTGFSKILSVVIWATMFLLSVPNIILSNKEPTAKLVKKCADLKGPAGLKWHSIVNYICQIIFWVVCITMVVLYTIISKKVYKSYIKSRSKDGQTQRKTKAKVLLIVQVFFTCFALFHFVRLPYTFSQMGKVRDCGTQNTLYYIKETGLWLCASNICLDPLIYIFLCKAFRSKICKKQENSTGIRMTLRMTQSTVNED
ncbi:P2Y purinoceptor 13-like [Hemitrygon akajei]|uniref:P2Y purinoceptor 13-like n=1 Tax=Hemitrygon akajei TaxID=2704970 RepID=UPI003BF961BC